MLEEEGIVFGEGGMSDKIPGEFFVDESSSSSSASVSKPATKSKVPPGRKGATKKRKMDASPPDEIQLTTKAKGKSKYFATAVVSEERLKDEILNLLQKRDVGKTC